MPYSFLCLFAIGNVREAFDEVCPAPQEDGRHGLYDGTDISVGFEEHPFGVIHRLPKIGDGTLANLRGADVFVTHRADDMLSFTSEHPRSGGIYVNDNVSFRVHDNDAGRNRIEDHALPGFAFAQRTVAREVPCFLILQFGGPPVRRKLI